MTAVLIAVIAAVAVAVTIVSARRALAERDAVERHHHTLEVLGAVSGRADSGPSTRPPTRSPARSPGPSPRRPRDRWAGRSQVMPPLGPSRPPAAAPSVSPLAREYQPRHRQARPRRRWGRPASAVAVSAAVVTVAVAGAWFVTQRPPGPSAGRARPAPQAPGTTTSGTAPTTAPGPAVVLVASDNLQAHFRVARTSVDVELVPTAACWVQIKNSIGGPVVFVGTLRAGSRKPVPVPPTGDVTVLLGNPSGMSVTVDGASLPFPRPTGTQPFTLSFQPLG